MKLILLIAGMLAVAPAFAQVPTNGLLRQYSFSGNANDESSFAQHGTVVGATLTTDRFGNPNSAYSFDGVADYISLPTSNLLGLDVYSFSIWIRPSGTPTNYSGVAYSIGADYTNQDQSFTYQPATTLFAGSFNTGNQLPFQSKAQAAPMAPNQWIHAVVVRDSVEIKMYVNGVLLPAVTDSATHNQPAAYGTSSRAIVGGRSHLPWDSFFPGDIDDIRHYNRILTPSEVTALYNEYRPGNLIKGHIYSDTNSNSVKDSSESSAPNVIVQIDSSGVVKGYSASNLDGNFNGYTRAGNYSISIPYPPLYHTVTPTSHAAAFATIGQIDSLNNFGLSPIPDMNDLRITLTSFAAPRPGFDSYYQLTYKNLGTTTLSGSVKFLPDSLFNFDSASVAITPTLGDTLSWNFSNLAPGQQSNIVVALNMPATATLGDTIYNYAAVTPVAGDQTPLDNVDTLTEIIIGSYDPNDRAVSPAGDITPQQVAAAVSLTYTIRFQNTGTAEAINVVITDTLSHHVSIPSLEIISASHNYTFTLKGNVLVWSFNNIMLPDSNTNEPASHGFIKYRIKPKTNLQLNDVIENTANIYFDFNEPVITNTTSTMVNLVNSVYLPLSPNLSASIYPNPGRGEFTLIVKNALETTVTTQIVNALGQVVYSDRSFAKEEFFERKLDLRNLASGIYFLQVSNGNRTTASKLIIQK